MRAVIFASLDSRWLAHYDTWAVRLKMESLRLVTDNLSSTIDWDSLANKIQCPPDFWLRIRPYVPFSGVCGYPPVLQLIGPERTSVYSL